MKNLISLLALFFLSTSAWSQIKAVESFVSETEGIQKYFIYQSSLRMLNQEGDEDFNRLIKNIRKINVYIAEESSEASKVQFDEMTKALARDDFETLLTVRQGDMRLNMMSQEKDSRAFYVLTANEGNSLAVLEMDGKLDLRYLQSLENVNFDKLRSIVGQETQNEAEPELKD